MKTQHPRSELSTHEVINQPPLPGDFNLSDDPAFKSAIGSGLAKLSLSGGPKDGLSEHAEHLSRFGKLAGSADMRELGRLANENKPVLKAFDARGRRLDEVEYHPAYHQLMKAGLENGVSSIAWTAKASGHMAHAALAYMMGWADTGVGCPMTMTYAVAPVLQHEDWTHETWLAGVISAKYDGVCKPASGKSGLTMGMAMTEKQGGSDLRANTTKAKVGADGEAELTGHKWFCSAPMSDGFLTLAYEDTGLSCFLVPKWRPDGTRNAIEIQRLKDKMGDHSNASSEIEYRGAWAKRVGEPGRGIPTIINMAHHTRFDCITGSASGMRKAVTMAAHFARHRTVFQKKLIDQVLMQNTLADLALESEAALALSFTVAAGFDAPKDSHAHTLSRILTPVAKYWVCKRQPSVVAEALECLGGVGFVEESGLPRLFRTSPLNSVWEGSGNIIALDIMRALQSTKTKDVFSVEMARIGGDIPELQNLTNWLQDTPNADARLFAERAALVFAADALPAGPLREAWITLRIQNPTHIWGANAGKIDAAHIVSRLDGWHQV
ncbi:MAG: acyl-CoA dehydrogenase family protein [Robiginitomaculum sp.]|nr:acyl-CoA dehydrogenase family protein [Robiginitomaculum sp.]